MINAQHAHIYRIHSLHFIFGEIFFLKILSIQPLLESHIFVERKRDSVLKARQVVGGNKQQGHIMKEDASSPTVSSD